MIKYETVDVQDKETFKYKLLSKRIFVLGRNVGKWEMYDPQGNMVAKSYGSTLVAFPNYMWDGSTVIGDLFEDEVTLEASLVHDILYNAKKNPDDIPVPFCLGVADKILCEVMQTLYKMKKASFYKKYIFPKLYLTGLLTVGIPWKFGNNKYYTIKLA